MTNREVTLVMRSIEFERALAMLIIGHKVFMIGDHYDKAHNLRRAVFSLEIDQGTIAQRFAFPCEDHWKNSQGRLRILYHSLAPKDESKEANLRDHQSAFFVVTEDTWLGGIGLRDKESLALISMDGIAFLAKADFQSGGKKMILIQNVQSKGSDSWISIRSDSKEIQGADFIGWVTKGKDSER